MKTKKAQKLLDADPRSFSPSELIEVIGLLFDLALDRDEVSLIDKGMVFAREIDEHLLSVPEKVSLNYNLSNGWFSKRYFEYGNQVSDWIVDRGEMSKGVFHLRKCISTEGFDRCAKELQCQVLTNLGNHFSHVGQFIEAMYYWRKALDVIPDFPMALANTGMGLYRYASYQHLDTHRGIFVNQSYQYLKRGWEFRSLLHPGAALDFQSLMERIENQWPEEFLNRQMDFTYNLGKQKRLRKYREWGILHQLYLNPLNDLGNLPMASHDCLHLPSMTVTIDAKPIYHSLYNQLKQEYGTARFLFYEGTACRSYSYSDKDIVLVDTLEYAEYSLNLEKVKIAYRLIYSVFDKIAYLLNDYLGIGIAPNEISFRGLWHKDKKGMVLRDEFKGSENLPLKALYWLSKDLFDREENITVIEPESRALAEIRNHIEHRSFKVKQFGTWGEIEDDFCFAIGRPEFEAKTLKQLKLARAAMIYLSLAVHHEEKYKNPQHVIPTVLPDMRREYKF